MKTFFFLFLASLVIFSGYPTLSLLHAPVAIAADEDPKENEDPNEPSVRNLTNPLGDVDSPEELILRIIVRVLALIGIISVAMFIYGGILLLTSGGSTEMVKKGRATLTWAIIGVGVVLASYSVMKYVFDVFTEATA